MDLNDLSKNPEQIKSLISLLQLLLDNQANSASTEPEEKSTETRNPKIKTKGSRKPNKNKSENKFEKMSEFRMHKDDTAVDHMLCKHPPVARMREFEMVDVVCRVCGKKETVSPSLVFDSVSRYKCNNCSTQSG